MIVREKSRFARGDSIAGLKSCCELRGFESQSHTAIVTALLFRIETPVKLVGAVIS